MSWTPKLQTELSWTDIGILISGFVLVFKAVSETVVAWMNKRKEAKAADDESKKASAETGNTFADTSISFAQAAEKSATLYREALTDVEKSKQDIRRQDSEISKLKDDVSLLKSILEAKDREYLVMKQQLADHVGIIERQQNELRMKNSQIEKYLKKIEEQDIIQSRLLVGIEILLHQMKNENVDLLWYPTKDKLPGNQGSTD